MWHYNLLLWCFFRHFYFVMPSILSKVNISLIFYSGVLSSFYVKDSIKNRSNIPQSFKQHLGTGSINKHKIVLSKPTRFHLKLLSYLEELTNKQWHYVCPKTEFFLVPIFSHSYWIQDGCNLKLLSRTKEGHKITYFHRSSSTISGTVSL